MTKLTLAISMMSLAITLGADEARAGMPMMDEPILLSVHGQTGCAKRNCIAAETPAAQQEGEAERQAPARAGRPVEANDGKGKARARKGNGSAIGARWRYNPNGF